MTHDEMEIRIIRLEEVIRNLLNLSYKFDGIIKSGEEQIKKSDELLALLANVRMDLAQRKKP